MPVPKDIFTQFFRIYVAQTVADTLTFSAELRWGIPVLTNQVIMLHKLEFVFTTAGIALMTAAGDYMSLALVNSSSISGLALSQSEVYDRVTISASGAVTLQIIDNAIIKDFSNLPGGGLMIPSTSMFLAILTAGLGTVTSGDVRGFYTFRTLKPAEYLELAQRLKVLT